MSNDDELVKKLNEASRWWEWLPTEEKIRVHECFTNTDPAKGPVIRNIFETRRN